MFFFLVLTVGVFFAVSRNVFYGFSFIRGNTLGLTTSETIESEQFLKTEYLRWQKIIADSPDYAAAYPYIITLAHKLHKDEDAVFYYEKAIKKDPNNAVLKTYKRELGL